MTANNDKTVLVFKDDVSKIEFCDMGQQLADLTNPPIVFVCENGQCSNGELTDAEKYSIQLGNPENLSVWISKGDGSLECVSKPTNRGLLETTFKSELMQRLGAYTNAIGKLGVKELHIVANESIKELQEKEREANVEAAATKAGNGGSVNGGFSSQKGSGFLHEIQKKFDMVFEEGALVNVDKARPLLEKNGFWEDAVVQAVIDARQQGRDVIIDQEINSSTTDSISEKFACAANIAAKTIAWDAKVDLNYKSSVDEMSIIVQNLRIIIKTGFTTASQNLCPSCNHAVSDDMKFCPYCGAGLLHKCSSCGTELKPVMKFCPNCGAKV